MIKFSQIIENVAATKHASDASWKAEESGKKEDHAAAAAAHRKAASHGEHGGILHDFHSAQAEHHEEQAKK